MWLVSTMPCYLEKEKNLVLLFFFGSIYNSQSLKRQPERCSNSHADIKGWKQAGHAFCYCFGLELQLTSALLPEQWGSSLLWCNPWTWNLWALQSLSPALLTPGCLLVNQRQCRCIKGDFKWPSAVLGNGHSGTGIAESISFPETRKRKQPWQRGHCWSCGGSTGPHSFPGLAAGEFSGRWGSFSQAEPLLAVNTREWWLCSFILMCPAVWNWGHVGTSELKRERFLRYWLQSDIVKVTHKMKKRKKGNSLLLFHIPRPVVFNIFFAHPCNFLNPLWESYSCGHLINTVLYSVVWGDFVIKRLFRDWNYLPPTLPLPWGENFFFFLFLVKV